jgi:hypothetical protein
MLIRKAKYNQFDVFLGKGWKFWGRFLVKKSQAGQRDSLIKLKGSPFTREEIEEVEMKLCHT